MTNLLAVLPDFNTRAYTHILPSLERAWVSTADLLTLDAIDVAKRAQVPAGEVKKLATAVLEGLQAATHEQRDTVGNGNAVGPPWRAVSTLDDYLDRRLGGGIPPGYVTEFVGESAAGKTQFLLTLLLSAQLPAPRGLGKSALYISTEAPLQTTRLTQILESHPSLGRLAAAEKPSLSRVHSTHIHDLEAQDHILRYQVPVVVQRHDIGLLIIDSIAANYRPEFDKGEARKSAAENFAKRSNQIAHVGALLRALAYKYNVAVVVANQVADRFTVATVPSSQVFTASPHNTEPSRRGDASPRSLVARPAAPPSPPPHPSAPVSRAALLSTDDPISIDRQQCFYTGWGDDPSVTNVKTPSLGLTWTNQLATRIALLKQPMTDRDGSVTSWRRVFKVVFSAWCAESTTEFEITERGVRACAAAESCNT